MALALATLLASAAPAHADEAALLRRIEAQDQRIVDQNTRIEKLEQALDTMLKALDGTNAAATEASPQAAATPAPTDQPPGPVTPAPVTPAPIAVSGDPFSGPGGAKAYDPERSFSGPLGRLKSADGAYSLGIGGVIQADAAFYMQDSQGDNSTTQSLAPDLSSGTTVRRAIVGLNGVIDKDWIYVMFYDVADTDTTVADGLRSALLVYRGFGPLWILAGQQSNTVSMDALTFSSHRNFIESASPTAFAFAAGSPALGVAGLYRTPHSYIRLGLYGEPLTTVGDSDEGVGIHGRALWIPFNERTKSLALGASGYWRTPTSDRMPGNAGNVSGISYSARTELAVDTTSVVDTGTIPRVENYYMAGVEAAAVYGPFSLQGEYIYAGVTRKNGANEPDFQDLTFDGYYFAASYFLTGESRNFWPRFGGFWRVKPFEDFSWERGTWGAWELAARYSTIDLNDGVNNLAGGGIRGGEAESLTLGINWYLNPFVKMMVNYVHTDIDNLSDTGLSEGDVIDAVGLRLQVEW